MILHTFFKVYFEAPAHCSPKTILQARCTDLFLWWLYQINTDAWVLIHPTRGKTAVGYGTLYGDRLGGYQYCDVIKMMLRLADFINGKVKSYLKHYNELPSAELMTCQFEHWSLPDFNMLDFIFVTSISELQNLQSYHKRRWRLELY